MKKFIFLSAIIFCGLKFSYAQTGDLDSSFGTNGIVTTDLGESINYKNYGRQVLSQTDGSMYVIFQAGNQTLITKRLPNGFADLSYGRGGFSLSVQMIDAYAVMQPDGKIVVAGSTEIDQNYSYEDKYDLGIVRYNTNGSLDNTFDNDGKLTTDIGSEGNNDYAKSIAIQKDGKILVLGQSAYEFYSVLFLARYNKNGNLDNTFDGDGMVLNEILTDVDGQADANGVAILNDGKILVAGSLIVNDPHEISTFVLLRFNKDGGLDFTFSGDGKQTTRFGSDNSFANAIAIQSDGKIILAGNTAGDFALVRYNTTGSLDKTFSGDGKQTTGFGSIDVASSLAIQNDGKIVAAGSSFNGINDNFEIARYNTNGSLDITLSGDGKITSDFTSIDRINSIAIQINGKIVITGYTFNGTINDFAVVRYNVNGSRDKTFNGDGKLSDRVQFGSTNYTGTAIQSDGKIVAAGFILSGSNHDFALARYNTDASLDSTFDGDGKQTTDFSSNDDYARSVAMQSDGKIILAGLVEGDFALARYNTDGSLDNTFSDDGKQTNDFGFNDDANSVAIQNDGKIVVAGSSVARYNSDGLPDVSFGNNGRITTLFSYNDIVIQSNGKIVAVGYATDGSNNDFTVVRYNIDGSLDKSFSKDGIQTTDLNPNPNTNYEYSFSLARSVAIQHDGKIIVAGSWVSDYFKVYFSVFAVVRYNQDGSIDKKFSNDGKQITDFGSEYADATSVAIQGDGKIIVAGSSGNSAGLQNEDSHFSLARYNVNGSLDKSFSNDGKIKTSVSGQKDFISDITIVNNKLYAAGYSESSGNLGAVARYLLSENSNKPPTLTLATLYNIVNFTAPARIKLTAAATDEDGTINRVQFYNGSTLLHTETVFPYGFLWDNVPVGNYRLTAKAYDDKDRVITSNAIEVSVVAENVAPVVSIVNPVDNTTYTGPATIRLIANAKDPNDRISKVEFFSGLTLLRTEYYYPHTYTWNNVQPGTYTITAVATDDKGLSTTSDPVTVTVTTPVEPLLSSSLVSVSSKINLSGALSVKLSPNPASNILHIYAKELQRNKQSTISVVSASGVVMKTIKTTSSQIMQMDVSSLRSEVYFLKVLNGDKVGYTRFVKL